MNSELYLCVSDIALAHLYFRKDSFVCAVGRYYLYSPGGIALCGCG